MGKKPVHINFFAVLILVGSFLLGFALCALLGLEFIPHEQLVGMIMTPIESAATSFGNAVGDFFSAYGRYQDVVAENERLRRQLSETQIELQESYYLQYENDNLRGLLALQESYPDFVYAEAKVVSRATDGWSDGLNLDIGSASGVKTGSLVVTGDGLVGVIDKVGLNWSTVTTLTDLDFSAGAIVLRTGDTGFTATTTELRSEGYLKLTPLALNTMVNRGDIVVTSGLGGRFPKGLVIGTVSTLQTSTDGLSEYAVITPAVDTLTVRRVYVVTNFEPEEISQ